MGAEQASPEWHSRTHISGPNIRKGFRYPRPRWLADIVPTLCYITGNPVPADAEGGPIYQIMEDPDLVK